MSAPTPPSAPRRSPPLYRALAALPATAILVGVPCANQVHAYVLGMPFLLFWIVACVLLTSVVMAVVGELDRRRARSENEPPPR